MSKYPHLNSPGQINRKEIRNRVFMSAMGTNLAEPDGSIGERIIAYYAQRAKGGAGVIVPGVVCVDYPQGKTIVNQIRLDQDKYIPGVQCLAEEVHRYGALLFLQLHHAGRQTHKGTTEGMQPVCPSECPDSRGKSCRVLSESEIQEIIGKFIKSALFARIAGVDGICLHAAHGYLLSQFLSPAINKRDDRYGGSAENRFRIVAEIIEGIRCACGPDFVIGARLGAVELIKGGYGLEEGKLFAQAAARAGLDYIDVSYGALSPSGITFAIETQSRDEGNRIKYAQAIKSVVDIPVVLAGKMREPEMCDKAVAEKQLDFVALGRQLIADPSWVEKAESGHTNEIRKCLSCSDGCFGQLVQDLAIRCAINPLVGKEYKFPSIPPAIEKKHVLVIGAGPAGIQAAVTAARRGHRVTLLEKDGWIGGQLNLACRTPHKEVLADFMEWGIGELSRRKVKVELNTPATLESIKEQSPDLAIVATGSGPLIPPIPGAAHTVGSWEVLDVQSEPIENSNVSIIGGGIVGCEVADLLAEKGNKVTVFELLGETATGLESCHKFDLMCSLQEHQVTIKTNTTVKEITPEGVHFENEGGGQFLAANKVILSIGQKPVRGGLAESIMEELNIPARYIGDARNVGKIINAVSDGFYAGYDIRDSW